ncbi:5-methylcytosine-specific restriction endonuclease system specificity protein McrC [Bifidobacterium sp. 82T10]|uniref:5-methylcytosine-specific restriction endonuclease system specificity protein McrC n=1 Tax=Bifidobacterium miconis TaxID=2834435 RepID=A0ABS6WBQ9_9BIFI|nr:5-methylcytosine-specific restriction endonuclease system specificity protein McrC [Bifidobacterium miconis]MBW3091486.1 5-methylcytosine-specific restriction endonuclease system specificity protein McrC [Bifidobacterium miconis]
MTSASTIPIRNVYYMLSYAFRALREQQYRKLDVEPFANMADLCAAILIRGMAVQLKRGLTRDYIPRTEETASPRGRIEIAASLNGGTMQKRRLVCTMDEFTVDSPMNRIIKSTMMLLLHADVAAERKAELRKLLVYLADVRRIDVRHVDWHMRYGRNNQTYQMLIGICYLIVKGLLQGNSDGAYKLMDFLDDQRMSHLYENFLMGYYTREWKGIINTSHHRIPWMGVGNGDDPGKALPVMQPDIVLDNGQNVLIIDAKYYTSTMQASYDRYKLRSANLYQIFTYVKNKDAELAMKDNQSHDVSGLLLYAKTDEDVVPDNEYSMGGNRIGARTVDLNQEFSMIAQQLDDIVIRNFSVTR